MLAIKHFFEAMFIDMLNILTFFDIINILIQGDLEGRPMRCSFTGLQSDASLLVQPREGG